MSEQDQQPAAGNELNAKPDSRQTQSADDGKWQRDVIEKLAVSALAEQKTARRWSTLFKGLTFAYIFVLILIINSLGRIREVEWTSKVLVCYEIFVSGLRAVID